jgi:hypothetical protein
MITRGHRRIITPSPQDQAFTSHISSQPSNQPNVSLLSNGRPLRLMNSIKAYSVFLIFSYLSNYSQYKHDSSNLLKCKIRQHLNCPSYTSICNPLDLSLQRKSSLLSRNVLPYQRNFSILLWFYRQTIFEILFLFSVMGSRAFLYSSRKTRNLTWYSKRESWISILFTKLLQWLTMMYNVRMDCFHLFFDSGNMTIVFNRWRSLFFNIEYYLELHPKDEDYSNDASVLYPPFGAKSWWYWFLLHMSWRMIWFIGIGWGIRIGRNHLSCLIFWCFIDIYSRILLIRLELIEWGLKRF